MNNQKHISVEIPDWLGYKLEKFKAKHSMKTTEVVYEALRKFLKHESLKGFYLAKKEGEK